MATVLYASWDVYVYIYFVNPEKIIFERYFLTSDKMKIFLHLSLSSGENVERKRVKVSRGGLCLWDTYVPFNLCHGLESVNF